VNQDIYDLAVSERADRMIAEVGGRERQSMWSLHTCLKLDTMSDKAIIEVVATGLKANVAGFSKGLTGGPFHVLPAMLLLCRWEERLPQDAIDLIHQFMTRGMLERGNTENHWLMFYAANLLAAERWQDETVFWNGRPPCSMEAEATRWISGMIDRTAINGHHEYDSPGYHVEHMMPLIGLYEHTRNDTLREKVEKMLALFVADSALEYFYGSWAGGHSREGYRENTWTRVGPIRPLQYLYFGGEPFNPEFHLQQAFAFPVLLADYRPSALFADIAWDRDRPHVVMKSKVPRSILRHTDEPAKPVRKYTYMSPSFALGTSQVGLTGDSAGPIDLISWDLHWRGEKHQAKITCNHPFVGAGRFSSFLTPLPQTAGRAVGSGKPYLQRPDRLFGASPFEKMMQHEGTALILYRIPDDDENPFVNLYLPRKVDWIERNGWLFGDLDDFYVAVRPIGNYEWLEIKESVNDAIMVTTPDLIDGWLLRIQDRNAGLVLEAVEMRDVGSYEAYIETRSASDVDLSEWPSASASVGTREGKVLRLEYEGDHTVDGVAIDYQAWAMYGSPHASAKLGTGQMWFGHDDQKLEIDFSVDDGTLIPMRVIG
jgi:hypothetical protein